ncbi:tyrosyl-dna phosphodiesterase 2 [Phtheirospermum japonicum]|uniref:Tyrosyl-dna phosphodiesterase 2 n=1 Tax=Phtheirospermum japonicum TaxID=374723 RepID=A0A830C1D5_9LAMI|nr:tyrosyl-dna phosphodiesterase 2 [Phtheirospermum japonicum]
MSSWTCSKCTYLNPPTQKSHCEICLSTQPQPHLSPSSSSPSKPRWSCASCTFLNPYDRALCEICGARASASILSTLEVDDDEVQLGSSIGSVFLPLRNLSDADRGNPCITGNGSGYYGGLKDSVSPLKRGDCGVFGKREKKDVGNGGKIDFDFGGKKGFSLSRCSSKMKEREIDVDGGGFGKREKKDVSDGDFDFGGKKGLLRCSNKRKERVIDVDDDGVDESGSLGFRAPKTAKAKAVEINSLATSETHQSSESKTWKVLSYNIWFREDLEMRERMRALGNLIELHSPDVICFQEVTPSFYELFTRSRWWKGYCCSIPDETAFPGGYFCMQLCKLPVKSYSSKPFHNSIMGRKLCIAEIEMQPDTAITVATSHLESPCPGPPKWDQMFSKERVVQANEAVQFLDKNQNAIFCGDMNWDDKLDGPFPLPDGWADAWTELRPGEVGFTYDTKSNKMLSGNRSLQKRLDRFICKLKDFRVSKIEMIGTDAIPGLSYVKEKKVKGQVQELELPVLPSDHYGLLLTICPRDSA